MKDISIYFSPIDIAGKWHDDQIGAKIVANNKSFPEIQKNSCALIYVPEFRGLIEAKKFTIKNIGECKFIFPNIATGKPYTQIFYPWDIARKRAGLGDVRIHDLRHSFASALVNEGMTLYDVKELLGHANIATTQRYAHLSQQRLMEAASKADLHYNRVTAEV